MFILSPQGGATSAGKQKWSHGEEAFLDPAFFTFNKFHFKMVAQHSSKEINYMSHAPFNLRNLVAINIVILNFFL